MKTLYIDCSMGAAGDMLASALSELLPDADAFVDELNALGIPKVSVSRETSVKCGIRGTHLSVKIDGEEETEEMHAHNHEHHHHEHETEHHHHDHDHDHEHEHHHHHSGLHDIEHIIESLAVSEKVKDDVMAVYSLIAEAESHAHGVSVGEVHFHEVGAMDAVADITAVCMLMERLSPDRVVATPVNVGGGSVKCAHGILPVPAPATAYILRGVPTYGGEIKSELCTPTGAALLKYFASGFGEMPVMTVSDIGYGMGKKDFERANCVRAFLGESAENNDTVAELSCNLDDMTGEEIGFTSERLFAAGALEVYTTPIQMKKSRPGVLLSVMCREEDREEMLSLIFRHTSTLGVRESVSRRYVLNRSVESLETEHGKVRRKVSCGYGVKRVKYEYDDIARIARETGESLSEVTQRLKTEE